MGLRPYPDSSFIFSLVSKDSRTLQAMAYMSRVAAPMSYTPLHRTEVRNALRNAVGRKEITEQERRIAFRQIDDDVSEGMLVHLPVDWTRVLQEADQLSEKHAARHGQRTIDLLHVAIARDCGAKIFLSFDERQKSLARAAGLEVRP